MDAARPHTFSQNIRLEGAWEEVGGMDFGFSPEQKTLAQAVTRFAERELLPDYQRRDKEKAFPGMSGRNSANCG